MAAAYLERMGERIRTRREELGLSRGEVARRMPGKTNENAIYRWEKGLHRANPDALEALAQVLDVPVAHFMAPSPDDDEKPMLELLHGSDMHFAADLKGMKKKLDALELEHARHVEVIETMLARQTQLLTNIEALVLALPPDAETAADLRTAEGEAPPAAQSPRGTGAAAPARRTRRQAGG